TTPVGADVARVEPNEFRARTSTRIVCPTSSVPSCRVGPVDVSRQSLPEASQRRHWKVNEIGPAPVQVPEVALTVSPCLIVPATVGSAVLTGEPSVTTADAAETAAAEPSELAAVTVTRSRWPTSSLDGLYVCDFASLLLSHLSPLELQRCQR